MFGNKKEKFKEHNGESTQNARIKIDYSGVKPKVEFSYPDSKNQVSPTAYYYPFVIWMIILGIGWYSVTVYEGWNAQVSSGFPYYNNNYTVYLYDQCHQHYYKNYAEVIDTTCTLYSKNMSYFYPEWDLRLLTNEDRTKKPYLRDSFFFPFWISIVMFLPPMFIYLPFRKFWKRIYPKIQGALASKKIAIFKPEDIIEQNGELYFEIPLHHNVIMNYEATEDFSEFLKLFEIKEHPFIWYRGYTKEYKKLRRLSRRNKTPMPKLEEHEKYQKVNEWMWRARFYYTKKPMKGMLRVYFR